MLRARILLMLLAFASGLYAEPVAMKTREFKIEFDLLELGRRMATDQPAPAAERDPFAPQTTAPAIGNDPFAPRTTAPAMGSDPFGSPPTLLSSEKPPEILTSKDILVQMGILFPEGATSFYDSSTGILRVHNIPGMLELIETLVKSCGEDFPRDIVCSITVIEGPSEIIRQANANAAKVSNASAELRKLLDHAKQPSSKVRVVNDSWLQVKTGTRATSRAALEHIHITGLAFDAEGHATLKREMLPLGLEFEIEPTIGYEGNTIETTFALRLNLAPPEQHPVSITDPGTGAAAEYSTTDFFHAEFITGISVHSGSTKLIGVTEPMGKGTAHGDRLWAAFLTATIHQQVPVPAASPPPPAPPSKKLPTGLQTATFKMPQDWLYTHLGYTGHSGEPGEPLQKRLENNGVHAAKGASAVQKNGLLHVINTPDNIERISVLVDKMMETAPRTIECTLHTVQAPAAFLREQAHASAAAGDHTALWAQVEAAVARGEGRFIDSRFIECRSEARAKNTSASEHLHVEDFGLDAKGRAIPSLAFRNVGSMLEIEPTLTRDGRTLDIILSYELHPAGPVTRREAFRDPASGLRFDLPVTDFHSLRTETSLVMSAGGTRLLSLHQPTGRAAEGMLWATFLKCEVVTQALPPQAAPPPANPFVPSDPESWHIQKFKVPPDFLSSSSVSTFDSSPAENPGSKAPRSARSVLEAAGILFPDGATAIYDPAHSRLIVRNTRQNLDLVEAYACWSCRPWPRTTVYTAQVFQGPGPLLRQLSAQAASKCDHRSTLDALLAAVKSGTVQALNTARIETKFGTRAMTTQARRHTSLSAVKVNDKNETEFEQDVRQVGLTLSIEPSGRADGRAVETALEFEFHPAEPQEHPEHILDSKGHSLELPLTDYQVVHLTTGTLIPSGAARLVGLWKPTGKTEFEKEDILQVLIITCDLLWAEP